MSTQIHRKKTKRGIKYRVWSSSENRYLTVEFGDKGLRDYLLWDSVETALLGTWQKFHLGIDRYAEKVNSWQLEDEPVKMSQKEWRKYVRDIFGVREISVSVENGAHGSKFITARIMPVKGKSK